MHCGYIRLNTCLRYVVLEWLLLLIKNNKNKSTTVLKEGKAQLAHFATAPGVYLIHHTFSLPLKTSSIATWQGEPWVPEDLTSPPIWHTCTGGTGALSALGIVPGKCRLGRSGAKFTVLPLGLSISNRESLRTTKEICAYEINASHKNIVEDNFQLINW